MGYTASAHDSTAFKNTPLYRNIRNHFLPDQYILADKAYALERHIITPYKEPIAKQPTYTAFNSVLSSHRIWIEHTFGILKARWRSLYDIPTRIGDDAEVGHTRVINWTIACLVLHNMLASMKDNELWLAETIAQNAHTNQQQQPQDNIGVSGREREIEAKREGTQRRNDLRELIAMNDMM